MDQCRQMGTWRETIVALIVQDNVMRTLEGMVPGMLCLQPLVRDQYCFCHRTCVVETHQRSHGGRKRHSSFGVLVAIAALQRATVPRADPLDRSCWCRNVE